MLFKYKLLNIYVRDDDKKEGNKWDDRAVEEGQMEKKGVSEGKGPSRGGKTGKIKASGVVMSAPLFSSDTEDKEERGDVYE